MGKSTLLQGGLEGRLIEPAAMRAMDWLPATREGRRPNSLSIGLIGPAALM